MPNYVKKLIVKPSSKIRLKHFDPGYHGKHESHKSALPEIQENRQKMEDLQYLMYAENKHSLLIVLQGLDAAGKDGRSEERRVGKEWRFGRARDEEPRTTAI